MQDLEYYMDLPYRTEIVKDSEKDSFVAYCPELEGCITSGSTAIEAIEGIEDAKRWSMMTPSLNRTIRPASPGRSGSGSPSHFTAGYSWPPGMKA